MPAGSPLFRVALGRVANPKVGQVFSFRNVRPPDPGNAAFAHLWAHAGIGCPQVNLFLPNGLPRHAGMPSTRLPLGQQNTRRPFHLGVNDVFLLSSWRQRCPRSL